MQQVEIITNKWREDYNEKHPHGSLGGKSPIQYTMINQQGFYDNKMIIALSNLALP